MIVWRQLNLFETYRRKALSVSVVMTLATLLPAFLQGAMALPPPEEVPEEVARTEIILEARSPINGELLTAEEYAELRTELAERDSPPEVNSELQHLIFLLRVRKLLRTFTPL